jgi:hypothetical protein
VSLTCKSFLIPSQPGEFAFRNSKSNHAENIIDDHIASSPRKEKKHKIHMCLQKDDILRDCVAKSMT